ncbi:MAG: DUF6737 family protein [Cyanobacteria bacterium P01_F01_bin.150]
MTSEPSLPPPSSSLWVLKPWWCQPWSIILTGLIVPALAWVVSHRLWIVLPISIGILGWWIVFLYVVPKSYAEFVNAEQQKNNGVA